MDIKCNYCQDTGRVDKYGNYQVPYKGSVKACPACKKDGIAKIDVNYDEVIESCNRFKKRWTVLLDASYSEYAAQELEILIQATVYPIAGKRIKEPPVKYAGKTGDKKHRLVFHDTVHYELIKDLAKQFKLKSGTYSVICEDANAGNKKG